MSTSQREEFLQRTRELLESRRVGVLATHYRDIPHQSLIAYVTSEDLREIFFVTPRYTRKAQAMSENPNVSLLVDNRQNTAGDFDACIVVTAKGTAEELPAQPAPYLLPLYLGRHPYLEEFARSSSSSFFRIRVYSYAMVSSFQRVEELRL